MMSVVVFVALTGTAIASNFAILDQGCSLATNPNTCAFDVKQVPSFIQPVSIDGSMGGCVKTNGVCAFDRSITCANDGVAAVIKVAIAELATCALNSNFNTASGCPTICGTEINRAFAAQLIALKQVAFTTIVAAEVALEASGNDVIRSAITQVLTCTSDALSPAQIIAATDFIKHLTAGQIKGEVNSLKTCFQVSDADVGKAFQELIAVKASFEAGGGKAGTVAASNSLASSSANSIFNSIITFASMVFVPIAMILNM